MHTLCPAAICALRLLLSVLAFECLPLPLSARIFTVFLLDEVDCRGHPSVRLLERTPPYCDTYAYQRADKVCDLVVYAYLLSRVTWGGAQQCILGVLFLSRVAGVTCYLADPAHDAVRWFARLPDALRETMLLFALLEDLHVSHVHPAALVACAVVIWAVKAHFEVVHHRPATWHADERAVPPAAPTRARGTGASARPAGQSCRAGGAPRSLARC